MASYTNGTVTLTLGSRRYTTRDPIISTVFLGTMTVAAFIGTAVTVLVLAVLAVVFAIPVCAAVLVRAAWRKL